MLSLKPSNKVIDILMLLLHMVWKNLLEKLLQKHLNLDLFHLEMNSLLLLNYGLLIIILSSLFLLCRNL
uniref:Transmembrane protein n=1 Tax=Medicago truncatula TaxID=3880 RepID=I3S424_MEDTR|nr:unknown [Medicago truncatula]